MPRMPFGRTTLVAGRAASGTPARRRPRAAAAHGLAPVLGPVPRGSLPGVLNGVVLWALVSVLPGCAEPERPGTPPKDVLLITVDTLRADHLSAWLYPLPTSALPSSDEDRAAGRDLALDDLAAEGVAFARAYAPRGQTFPSTATLLTGATPFEHGAIDNRDVLPERAETLAERLGDAGFATGAFTANRLLVPGSGIEQGFEHFFPGDREEVAALHGDPTVDRDYQVLVQANQWIDAQRAADPDRPLFAWVHLMGPHLPYDPRPIGGLEVDYATLFADPDYAGEADGSREFLDAAYAGGRDLTGEDVARVVALYDAEIARVNRLLSLFLYRYGRIDVEGEPRHLDRTLLIFAADHGEELYQRNRYWAHSKSVYSSVLHVPLFFRHPPSLTGRRVMGEPVTLADVAPTVYDWFDLEPPAVGSGRSLLPLVDSHVERPFESRPAHGHWRDRIFTLTDGRWRLVWNPDGVEPDDPPAGPYPVPELALYDLDRDPLELTDVKAEHPDVTADLLGRLQQWTATQPIDAARRQDLGAERARALRELGYIDDEEAAEAEDR
jgi:arylsulfatase A-like enzyme